MRVMTRFWGLAGLVMLAFVLAACGGDKDGDDERQPEATPSPEVTEAAPQFSIGPGTDLQIESPTGGRQLPGCNDPSDTECPAPLAMDLDGEAASGGVTIQYPARYFTARTNDGAADLPLIEISPNQDYRFNEQAAFQVYFADSVDAALAELADPLTAAWSTDTLSGGTIGVVKDRTQDPPVNTTIGAFPLDDGRTVVFKLVTTGKYGWDLFSRVYEEMLDSLAVGTPADVPTATEAAQ